MNLCHTILKRLRAFKFEIQIVQVNGIKLHVTFLTV